MNRHETNLSFSGLPATLEKNRNCKHNSSGPTGVRGKATWGFNTGTNFRFF